MSTRGKIKRLLHAGNKKSESEKKKIPRPGIKKRKLDAKIRMRDRNRTKRNLYDKANWPKFQQAIREWISRMTIPKSVEEANEQFEDMVTDASSKAIPRVTVKKCKKQTVNLDPLMAYYLEMKQKGLACAKKIRDAMNRRTQKLKMQEMTKKTQQIDFRESHQSIMRKKVLEQEKRRIMDMDF